MVVVTVGDDDAVVVRSQYIQTKHSRFASILRGLAQRPSEGEKATR